MQWPPEEWLTLVAVLPLARSQASKLSPKDHTLSADLLDLLRQCGKFEVVWRVRLSIYKTFAVGKFQHEVPVARVCVVTILTAAPNLGYTSALH
jgi:hypothetical protein